MGLRDYIERLKYEKKYWEQRSLELGLGGGMSEQCENTIEGKEQLIAWLEELQEYREGKQ